jgi:hypothetical protein
VPSFDAGEAPRRSTSSLDDVSDNVLLSSLVAAMLAGFSHAVTRPLILYVLKKRHLSIYKTIPLRTDALDRTFKGNWPLSRFMLKFTVTGEFLALHDLGLSVLCVFDALLVLILILASLLVLVPSLTFLVRWGMVLMTPQHV